MPDTSNHELLVRVDNDVKHLSSAVHDVRNKQTEQERAAAQLTENLNRLTFSVGALVEGMKDAKEAMHTIGKHEQRITTLEERANTCDREREELSATAETLQDAHEKGKFLWKIVWTIVTTPVALGVLYAVVKFVNQVQ